MSAEHYCPTKLSNEQWDLLSAEGISQMVSLTW